MRGITKRDRDRLPIFGNQYKPLKVMPGTCEACVYGSGKHAEGCVSGIWRCTWCHAESHEPAPDELVICPNCGTAGCEPYTEASRCSCFICRRVEASH